MAALVLNATPLMWEMSGSHQLVDSPLFAPHVNQPLSPCFSEDNDQAMSTILDQWILKQFSLHVQVLNPGIMK